MENWRPVIGWSGYEVSDKGNVRSLDRTVADRNDRELKLKGKSLRPILDGNGYLKVRLCSPGQNKLESIHVLVAESFIGPRPEGMFACHNDGDNTRNVPDNLRWDTPSENSIDRVRHGRHHNANKSMCKHGHPLSEPNLVKGELKRGKRCCLACRRTYSRLRTVDHTDNDFKAMADILYGDLLTS